MPLAELLPSINHLSHQDKLRLMNFLLIAIAQEDGITLEPPETNNTQQDLLKKLASTPAVVWSPQTDIASVQSLFNLIETTKDQTHA